MGTPIYYDLDCKFFFFLMAAPRGLRDLSSLRGIKPAPPALEAWSLNHWTAKEVPGL